MLGLLRVVELVVQVGPGHKDLLVGCFALRAKISHLIEQNIASGRKDIDAIEVSREEALDETIEALLNRRLGRKWLFSHGDEKIVSAEVDCELLRRVEQEKRV